MSSSMEIKSCEEVWKELSNLAFKFILLKSRKLNTAKIQKNPVGQGFPIFQSQHAPQNKTIGSFLLHLWSVLLNRLSLANYLMMLGSAQNYKRHLQRKCGMVLLFMPLLETQNPTQYFHLH